jgi:ketosteroid isomerase-like protein
MTQGPPCPNCGSLLAWFPDQQQWGCDRCRVMYPPQVMVQPQAYASGHARRHSMPRMKHPARGRAPGSRRALLYGAAAVVLVGGGIALALALIHRGKHATGGYNDRDTAVRETFRALAAGDLEALLSHAGTNLARTMVTCDEGKQPTDAKDREDLRQELSRAAEREKGSTFEVTRIDEPGKPVIKAKGESLMRGCKLDTDFIAHQVTATLAIHRGTKVIATDARITVAEVDGRFYVMNAPKLGGCDDAVARIALVAGRDTGAAELAKKLEVPLVAACSDDTWPAKVLECTSHALGVRDLHSCFDDLDATQRAHVAAAISGSVDHSPAAEQLRAIVPAAPPPPHEPPAVAASGPPSMLGIADFWVTARADGSFLVSSPLVTAVFPARPTAKVAKSLRPNAEGKLFDIYTIAAEPHPGELYQLELIAMGRNMRDTGGFKNLEAELAKLGTVAKAEHDGVTRFTVTTVAGGGGSGGAGSAAPRTALVLDGRIDLARGLIVNSTVTSDAEPAQTFLAGVHVLAPKDPLDDPETLVGVRQRKGTRGKLVLHDPDDRFTIDIPYTAKVERVVDPAQHAVVVTATSAKKRASVVITISELAPWDALAIGPTKLAELTGPGKGAGKSKTRPHLVWNAFQHRMYRVVCTEMPCDPIVTSLRVNDPAAPPP